jgi:hypothetical protein
MTYSTESSSVVAAELPGWMRVGFLTKRFDSGSTIRHAHETTFDGEFQQSVDFYEERGGRGEHVFPWTMTYRETKRWRTDALSRLRSGSLM